MVLLAILSGFAAVFAFIVWRRQTRPQLPLPPGPKPVFLLGNALQMPTAHEWLTFAEWAKIYGDIVHVHILGQSIVILDSLAAATDLLDKRSAIYSDRPRLVMAGELVLFNMSTPLMPYSDRHRSTRKLLHRELSPAALEKYWSLHEEQSKVLVRNTMRKPDALLDLIRHYAGSIILKVTYGYQTVPKHDPWLVLAEQVIGVFSKAATPGAWLVDFIPALKYLPPWLPGAGFLKTAEEWRRLHLHIIKGPYDQAKENQLLPELIKPNFTSTVLEQHTSDATEVDEDILMWTAGSLFGGGADTTVSAISSFYLAMALFPAVQKKAQDEIDRVIGHERLPELHDRPHLPYVEAVVRETLRWHPVLPLSLPHRLTQDDEYRGYRIPAGTIVMPNVWSMLHDPTVFPEPATFRPERFLDDIQAVKTVAASFGFGRRVCPGLQFAEGSIFVAIATALAACTISDPVDEHGVPVSPDVAYRPGTISHPKPFKCTIKPRFPGAADLLSTELARAMEV